MKVLFLEYKNFGKEDVLEAFKNLGIYVRCEEFKAIHDRVNEKAQQMIDDWIKEEGFDCIFTFNYSPLISNACKKNDIKYIAWTYDSPLVALFSYTIINPCNYVFVFDSDIYERFRKEGITTVHYIPLAANTKRLDNMPMDENIHRVFDADISFVGSMYNEKHNLYDRLHSMSDFAKGYLDGVMQAQMKVQGYFFVEEMLKGPVLEEMKKALEYTTNRDGVETPEYVYANYFVARKIAEKERYKLLSMLSEEFKVNLYTHNPTPLLPKVNNKGAVDYYDNMPYVFKCSKINLNISLRSIVNGIPLRCMDIMGAGGFLLTNYQADLFRHFEPGVDFVYYESEEDLIDKCRYYLSHEEERKQIAINGYEKICKYHTYEIRLKEMFEIAELI